MKNLSTKTLYFILLPTIYTTTRAQKVCPFPPISENTICTGSILPGMPFEKRRFNPGEFMCSSNKNYQFGYTTGGDLVICHNQYMLSTLFDAIEIIGKPGHGFSVLQKGGNFVLYDESSSVVWETKTSGNSNSALNLSNEGHVNIVSEDNNVIWSYVPRIEDGENPNAGDENECAFSSDIDVSSCIGILLPNMSADERRLNRGEFICSMHGDYLLGLTNDGSFSLCKDGRKLWSAGSFGDLANYAFFQKTGNLVLYDQNDAALWSTQTKGECCDGSVLVLSGRTITIFSSNGEILWSLATTLWPTIAPTVLSDSPTFDDKCEFNEDEDCGNILTPEMGGGMRRLYAGEYICSDNKDFKFGMTLDRKLSICENDNRVWFLGPFSGPDVYANFQRDGNLVVRDGSEEGVTLYSSETHGERNSILILQDNGLVQIINTEGYVVWLAEPLEGARSATPSTSFSPSSTFPPSLQPLPTASPTDIDRNCEFDLSLDDNPLCDGQLTVDMFSGRRRLKVGEFICSKNEEFFFGLTNDHYLSLCEGNQKVFIVGGPFFGPSPYANFQRDGNLVVHSALDSNDPGFQNLFGTGTKGESLQLRDNGIVEILDEQGVTQWRIEPEDGARSQNPSSTYSPTLSPTLSALPTASHAPARSITYHPGKLQLDEETGLYISEGLEARLIAKTDEFVFFANESSSTQRFHNQPDAAACFTSESGGWYYMSNSEVGSGNNLIGSVGRIEFDANGNVVGYKRVLEGTAMNCGCGTTPWKTFITCEEFSTGQCWEVDPEDRIVPRVTKMGGAEGGKFESAAFDSREISKLKGFVTTDKKDGALYRYTPDPNVLAEAMSTGNYTDVLHIGGTVEFLEIFPETNTFHWTSNKTLGMQSAFNNYQNTEGIDCHEGFLYFIAKISKQLFILDLDNLVYTNSSTVSGAFNGQPDQIVRLLKHGYHNNSDLVDDTELLYFLEDGGPNSAPAGIFARDKTGEKYFTIMEGGQINSDETTGLAFCDNGMRMMFAFQDEGVVYELKRSDGLSFSGSTVDIKYHGD